MMNSTGKPKVSVVVAVYNSGQFIRQTLDSILAQTLKDTEIILVDDGSKDDSPDILNEYAKADARIRVLVNTEESDGAASARNLGVANANGEYLSILDSDDFFEPDMLDKAYNRAKETSADVVIFDGYRYDDRNGVDLERNSILVRDRLPEGRDVFAPEDNAENLFMMTLGAAWPALFSKEHIDRYNLRFKSFHHADDLEFVYMSFALAHTIAVLRDRLVHYRVNVEGSQASMISRWPETAWSAMLSLKKSLTEHGIYERYKTAFVRKAMHYISFYMDNMNTGESFGKLYRALQGGKLAELDLSDAGRDEIDDDALAARRDLIMNASAEEYLLRQLKKEPPFDISVAWKKGIPSGSRLILYGADRMGVSVLNAILWDQDYKVIAWVDPQYEALGYPVVSPEVISNSDYDLILVTNISELVFEKVKKELAGKGTDIAKIRWIR